MTQDGLLVADPGPEDAEIDRTQTGSEVIELRLQQGLACAEENAGVAENRDAALGASARRIQLARRLIRLREHDLRHVPRVLECRRTPEQPRSRDAEVDEDEEKRGENPRDRAGRWSARPHAVPTTGARARCQRAHSLRLNRPFRLR